MPTISVAPLGKANPVDRVERWLMQATHKAGLTTDQQEVRAWKLQAWLTAVKEGQHLTASTLYSELFSNR